MGDKALVVYCYKEDDNSKQNLQYFLKHGVSSNTQVQYIFIINNSVCTVEFPRQSNIALWNRVESEYDVYSYKHLFEKLPKDYLTSFSNYLFLNSSCRGPFLPPYTLKTISTNDTNYAWISVLKDMLKQSDVVAPIVEYPHNFIGSETTRVPFFHTYMFALNRAGLSNFQETLANFNKTGMDPAIELERLVGRNCFLKGLRIQSLLTRFYTVNISNKENWKDTIWNPIDDQSCYEIPGGYFGMDVHPFEVMFVKNIRHPHKHRKDWESGLSEVLAKQLKHYTAWMG